MSELISGKEALIALANGEEVQASINGFDWKDAIEFGLVYFLNGDAHFRLKPRTVNLNGVEVGQLYSSQWDKHNPNKVTIEFKTEKEARHFSNNALKIFNGV